MYHTSYCVYCTCDIRRLVIRLRRYPEMRKRVVVTGLGIVSPLGTGVKRVWERLCTGTSGIRALPDTEEYQYITSRVVGMIPREEFNEDSIVSSSDRRTMSLSTVYGLCAAREALLDANWIPQNEQEMKSTGVSVGSCVPDYNTIETAMSCIREKKLSRITPYLVPRLLTNLVAGHISMRYNLKGPNHSVSTACATGLHSIGDAAAMIARGVCNVMVSGGTEACINVLYLSGFSRAKALSTKFNSTPQQASRPFDSQRDGFVLSEGSGIIVLEELEHALSRDATIYCEILGYGLAGDAFHITAPHETGQGAIDAMEGAIKDAGISHTDIGHINVHATSTPLGDAVENTAIKTLFGCHSNSLLISACKGSLGHTQSASGAIETILTVLAVNKGVCPPTINISHLEPEFNLNYCPNTPVTWDSNCRRIALKNSFGFGGTTVSLCIGEYIN